MKLKKVTKAEKSEYPSYSGYQTDRRKFLKNMVVGAGALVAGAAGLQGCQETRTAGVPVMVKGKIKQPTKPATARTAGVPVQEHPPLPGVAPRPAHPPGKPPAPTCSTTSSKETTTWMGVKEGDKKPVVLRGKIRPISMKKPVQLKGDIPCPEPPGK